MADDLDFEVFRRLSMEELAGVDFDAPVTRSELMQAMMAVHEALFAQVHIIQATAAALPYIPAESRQYAAKASGLILNKTGSLVQKWAGKPEDETSDGE